MNDTVNVTFRMDRRTKGYADQMFNGLGMSLSTAFNIFIRQSLRIGGLPFEVIDPFFCEANQERLVKSIEDCRAGRVTAHELIEVEDDDNDEGEDYTSRLPSNAL